MYCTKQWKCHPHFWKKNLLTYVFIYIYIWHHLIYINNIYIYILYVYLIWIISSRTFGNTTPAESHLFFSFDVLRHGRHKGGSHNVVPGLAHHFSWRLWRKRKAFAVRLMAAGLLPSRGMSPAFPPNGGLPGKIIDSNMPYLGGNMLVLRRVSGWLEPWSHQVLGSQAIKNRCFFTWF